MNKRTVTILLAILACVLLVTGVALAANGYEVPRHVIGGGGGRVAQGGYTLDYTIGQPVVGTSGAGTLELCSGFWCGAAGAHDIYLPLVLRD